MKNIVKSQFPISLFTNKSVQFGLIGTSYGTNLFTVFEGDKIRNRFHFEFRCQIFKFFVIQIDLKYQ